MQLQKKKVSRRKNIKKIVKTLKVGTETEVYIAIKIKKDRLNKKKNGKLKSEPLKEERRSSVDLGERRRRRSSRRFPSVIVVI
jgi:hypothetical protein